MNAEIELNEKRKKRKLSKEAGRELSFPSSEVTSISLGAASYCGRNLLHFERAENHRWTTERVKMFNPMYHLDGPATMSNVQSSSNHSCEEIVENYWRAIAVNGYSTCLVVVILNSYVICYCCLAATRSRGVSRGERRGEG